MPHVAPRRALIALAAALAVAVPAAHAMYKWVDEKGVTHFSENPPPDGRKATKIEPKVTPPSEAAPKPDWKAREQKLRQQRLEREQREEYLKGKAHNEAAERKNRCLRAQRELAVLARQTPVYSIDERGPKGYLEDKDRPAEVARWRRVADENCDSR